MGDIHKFEESGRLCHEISIHMLNCGNFPFYFVEDFECDILTCYIGNCLSDRFLVSWIDSSRACISTELGHTDLSQW